jgi:iron(II)-dependent oxidoreductase
MNKHSIIPILAAAFCLFILADVLPAQEAVAAVSPATTTDRRGTHGLDKSGASRVPPHMILIPKGDVVLGMNKELVEELGEGQSSLLQGLSASMPKHIERNVDSFYCDKFEVTNAQWRAFLDATGREPSELLRTISWAKGPDEGKSFPEGEEKFPVRNVELSEARAFAHWCGKRLPTEIEWSRAAAGDDGRKYAWGDEWNAKLCKNKRNTLMPVGSYPDGASPFGVMDMTGSVWEWTSTQFLPFDRFKPLKIKVGRKTQELDPQFDARQYVIKGGCYLGNDVDSILAVREKALPNTNYSSLGFRCVKSLKPGQDIFDNALSELSSGYLKDAKWDKDNFYALEISTIDNDKGVIVGFDHMVFAPAAGILTSISKIMKNDNATPKGFLPLGILSLSRPMEEPNLPPGAYTLVYRHKGAGMDGEPVQPVEKEEKPAPEEKPEGDPKKDPKKEGEGEEQEKTPEEIEREKEEARIAEENRKAKEAAEAENERARRDLERIGAVSSSRNDIAYPRHKNLILFLNASDTVVAFAEVDMFGEGGEEPLRLVHVQSSGITNIEFTTRILGSKHPRFNLPIKIRNNPFGQ